jgi:ubiquinol oxidase
MLAGSTVRTAAIGRVVMSAARAAPIAAITRNVATTAARTLSTMTSRCATTSRMQSCTVPAARQSCTHAPGGSCVCTATKALRVPSNVSMSSISVNVQRSSLRTFSTDAKQDTKQDTKAAAASATKDVEPPREAAPQNEFHRHSTRYNYNPHSRIKELETIEYTHRAPENFRDRFALGFVRFLRRLSDAYFKRRLVERAVMLETVAAVPGMVAGAHHHLRSLRRMVPCKWTKAVMDEAENERMHLWTWLAVVKPNLTQRLMIMGGQGVFLGLYSFMYLLSPYTSHRFVGYLEEEAVHTYSEMLKDVDAGIIKNGPAPDIAIKYWNMPKDATIRDVVLVVRADEADHRVVNHHMGDLHHEVGGDRATACEEFRIDMHSTVVDLNDAVSPRKPSK